MRTLVAIVVISLLVPIFARGNSAQPVQEDPNCYSVNDLFKDLKYGSCNALKKVRGKRGSPSFCSDLNTLLRIDPQSLIEQIFEVSDDRLRFTNVVRCRETQRFINGNINRIDPSGTTVLHHYAKNCDADNILLARIFGAREMVDRTNRQTPVNMLTQTLDQMNLALKLETDQQKISSLQTSIKKCQKALDALSKEKLTFDDIKAMDLPTTSKVFLFEYGKKRGLVVDKTK